VFLNGLATTVIIEHADPTDGLAVNTFAGNDTFDDLGVDHGLIDFGFN